MQNLSDLTERSPGVTQNITRFLGNRDIIRLTSTNNIFRKFGHIDSKTVRNKALSDRDITAVGRNWMSNQREYDINVGDDGFDGITDWEGETNQHYFTKREFNPTFTEDFLKDEVSGYGDGNWVPPVRQSIRDRVLAEQKNPYARAIKDRETERLDQLD